MFGILEAAAVPHGGIFDTYDDLILDLNRRMERQGYKIVKARSHRNKIGGGDVAENEIVRCDLVCDRGGRPYKSTATKHKTHTKKTGCPWKAKAVNRKSAGGWILTIFCNEHNHEAGTPEPPSLPGLPQQDGNDMGNEDEHQIGPRPDPETSAALQIAGVSNTALRLTGDTFHQFKTEYRKMTQGDRLSLLAQFQLRIAAIYAVQNEEMQRQKRQETQDQRHQAVVASRKTLSAQRHRARKHQRDQDEHPQQPAALPTEPDLSLPQDLVHIGPNQAPDAVMQESQFQMPGTRTTMPTVELPQFKQYHGPSKKTKSYQPQAT
ncbi:transcription factor, FAR1-related protein [Pochonia chlamydosporia 170]|uniref:Transcription factor, FAR1-related protein n=1 Tax=Pochonia chlamydosporia 170 TaxID=1380566 RepID=A0A179F2D4_METCM|nr:transcription factor, FAR1-related protein [Pochonia chlamydosporia 170]OAQ59597.1 transcription factor, FAR1-related protein [Pochonia chlamydosporia 170]